MIKTRAVIIRKEFCELITKHLVFEKRNAELLTQANPTGMGNAILQFKNSRNFNNCQNVILVWGDIPFIDEKAIFHRQLNVILIIIMTLHFKHTFLKIHILKLSEIKMVR